MATGASPIPLAWHTAPDVRDRQRLDAWCAAVGSPLLLNENDDGNALDESGRRAPILVVSWNVHVGAGSVADLTDWISGGGIHGWHGRDFVLVVQEAVRGGADVPPAVPPGAAGASRIGPADPVPARDIRDVAERLGLNLAYVPSMRNGRDRQDRGNAVLTTLPILSVDAIEPPFVHQRHVAVAATLSRGGDDRLRVVSVHFDSALRFGSGGPARWRREQARVLREALGPTALPTVVGGDLNTWWGEDEPAVRALRRAWPQAVDGIGSRRTWRGAFGAESRLDYLFAGGLDASARVERLPRRFGSDHYPVAVVVP